MKGKLLKSLLLSILTMFAAGVWAQTTTLLEYGTEAAPWSAESLAEWTAGGNPTINSGYVEITGGNGSYATSKTIAPKANALINVQAVWRGRSNTGRAFSAGNGSYFQFGNIIVAQNDQDKKHGYGFSGLASMSGVTTFTAGNYRVEIGSCTWLLIEMEINTASNTVTSFSVKSEDGSNTYATASNVLLTDADYTTVAFGYRKAGSVSTANGEDLKWVKITETVQVVNTADYKVKYVCNGIEVKDTVVRTGLVGDAITLVEADTLDFTAQGKKYIYVSNDVAGKTVAEGATVTVTFREAEKYSWTANSNVGSYTLAGETWEGDKANVKYPLYLLVGDTLYTKAAIDMVFNQSFNVAADKTEITLDYAKTNIGDVVFLAEVEDLEGMEVVNSGNAEARSSQRAAGYSTSGNALVTKLPQGKYNLKARFYSPTSAGGTYKFYTGGRQIWETKTGNSNGTDAETVIVLAKKENEILLGQTSATAAVDFIYIQKLADPTNEELNAAKSADSLVDAKLLLQETIALAEKIDTVGKQGKKTFDEAIKAAEAVFAAANATTASLKEAAETLQAAIKAFNEANSATFNFADPTFRENVGEAMTDVKGYIYNETFTVDGTSLQITGGSAPSRIYKDANRGQCLVTYKEYTTLTFRAPEGKAITQIDFTAAGNSNINNFTASSDSIKGMTWIGNADGVRFAQGGTSYLANAIVTLVDKNDDTKTLPEIEYTDCANIAAFNALAAGTYAKVTLTDAEVIGKSADGYSTVWMQDATGGCWIQYTSLNDSLKESTKVNGTVYVVKRLTSGNPHMKEAEGTLKSELNATDISEYTIVKGDSIKQINVAANLNKVVKIVADSLKMTSTTAGTLYVGPESIALSNGSETANQQLHKIADWKKDSVLMNVEITAILVASSATATQLLPIAIEQLAAPVDTVATDTTVVDVIVADTVVFNFADSTFRKNVGEALTDVNGYIYNETFTVDSVSLQITAGSAPSRIYKDANRGQCLVTYKEYTTLTFRAPEGKAITQIDFTAAGNSNINNFTASSDSIKGMTWIGNADGVRFAQGGTSYLANAIVTLVNKNDDTKTLPEIEYTECANIAAFNALEAGTYAKVTLTDAEVIGKSADGYSTVFIQDATGGCWIQYTSLNDSLKESTKVNGTVYVVKRATTGNPHMKEAEGTLKSELNATAINEYTIVKGDSIKQINVAANLNKVVKIVADSLKMTSATAGTLYVGPESIALSNGSETANQQLHKIADWKKDSVLMNVEVTAILVASSATATQLLPVAIKQLADPVVDGIRNFSAAGKNVTIFNLQGVRQDRAKKGLNIIGGKKVVIK